MKNARMLLENSMQGEIPIILKDNLKLLKI